MPPMPSPFCRPSSCRRNRSRALQASPRLTDIEIDGVGSLGRPGRVLKLPGIRVAVASTHGAGDAFVGTFAARAVGDPFEVALSVANREAAKLVSTPEGEREV
jgi:ribokinase